MRLPRVAESRSGDGPAYLQGALQGLFSTPLRARFTWGVVWSVAATVGSRGTLVLGTLAAARLLGAERFGEMGMVQATIALFAVFAAAGLGMAATRQVAEHRHGNPEHAGRAVGMSLVASAGAGAVVALVMTLAAPWLSTGSLGAAHLTEAVVLGSLVVLFGSVNGALAGALSGLEQFRIGAYSGTLRGAASALLLAAGAYLGGVRGAILGLGLGEVAGCAILMASLRSACRSSGIPIRWHGPAHEWRRLLSFGVPVMLSGVTITPVLWGARLLLVNQPEGYAQMGLFTAADKWSQLVLFLPIAVVGVQLPMLANLFGAGDGRAFRRVLRANLLVTTGLAAVLGLAMSAIAVPLMSAYGAEYREGWLVLVVLSLSAIPITLNTTLGQAVIGIGGGWWRFAFDVGFALVLAAAAWYLVPAYGAVGMALAYGVAYTLAAAGLYAYLRIAMARRLGA